MLILSCTIGCLPTKGRITEILSTLREKDLTRIP